MAEFKSGLKRLVFFHRLTGNTYMTWNFGKRQSIQMKILLILANIALFFVCIHFTTYQIFFDLTIANSEQENINKSRLPYIFHIISVTGFFTGTLFCFFLNLIKGKALLKFLYEQDIEINRTAEKRIVNKILIFQFSVCIIDELFYALIRFLENGPDHNSYWKLFVNYILFVLNKNIHLILLALLAYQCYVVEEKFREMTLEFKHLSQFKNLAKQVFKITNLVQEFNTYFNFYLFVTMIYYFIASINNATVFYYDRKFSILVNIPWTMEIILIMFLLCLVCSKIENGYRKFLKKYEILHEQNLISNNIDIDYCLVNRLYYMKEDLCITAYNMYKINIKTFMSLISLIITFAVIMIQTKL